MILKGPVSSRFNWSDGLIREYSCWFYWSREAEYPETILPTSTRRSRPSLACHDRTHKLSPSRARHVAVRRTAGIILLYGALLALDAVLVPDAAEAPQMRADMKL